MELFRERKRAHSLIGAVSRERESSRCDLLSIMVVSLDHFLLLLTFQIPLLFFILHSPPLFSVTKTWVELAPEKPAYKRRVPVDIIYYS